MRTCTKKGSNLTHLEPMTCPKILLEIPHCVAAQLEDDDLGIDSTASNPSCLRKFFPSESGAKSRRASIATRRRNRNRIHTLGWWCLCSHVVDARPACLPARAASPRGPGGTKEARRASANSYEPEWRRSAAAAIGASNGSTAQSPPSVRNRKAKKR